MTDWVEVDAEVVEELCKDSIRKDIREELEGHPALLRTVANILEEHYPVKVEYRIFAMGGWTEPPRLVACERESKPTRVMNLDLDREAEREGP